MMRGAIDSGEALAKFIEIVSAQGGNAAIVDDYSLLPQAGARGEFNAGRDGFVTEITPRTVGYGIIALGGGRTTMEDAVDPGVGFIINATIGTQVRRGDTIATIFARDKAGIRNAKAVLSEAISIGEVPAEGLPLVAQRISSKGVDAWLRPE